MLHELFMWTMCSCVSNCVCACIPYVERNERQLTAHRTATYTAKLFGAKMEQLNGPFQYVHEICTENFWNINTADNFLNQWYWHHIPNTHKHFKLQPGMTCLNFINMHLLDALLIIIFVWLLDIFELECREFVVCCVYPFVSSIASLLTLRQSIQFINSYTKLFRVAFMRDIHTDWRIISDAGMFAGIS